MKGIRCFCLLLALGLSTTAWADAADDSYGSDDSSADDSGGDDSASDDDDDEKDCGCAAGASSRVSLLSLGAGLLALGVAARRR